MEIELFDSIWKLSKESEYAQNRQKLTELTEELIRLYEGQGRLSDHPLTPSRERSLSLPVDLVSPVIKNKICLVTGGLGCVGSALIKELVKFDPKLIVIVDIKNIGEDVYQIPGNERIIYERCSILDFPAISAVFDTYQPQIVFHTAAQRDPGLAESEISHSVKTNVLGTWNLLSKVKQSFSVEQFVFSSTGKASRYYTKEIYSVSKKICEMLVDLFSKSCPQKYFSMVRFTHIVDNSLMDIELSTMAKNGEFVAIHSPGKYVTAQNVKEAAYLMLNGLIYVEREKSNILLVKNLEWPVESLEVALYYLKLIKRKIPIVFIGNPKGYGEKFFRGQFDWRYPGDLNLLLNVYENRNKVLNDAKDIIISSIIPFEGSELLKLIEQLKEENSDLGTKEILIGGLRSLFIGSLEKVDKEVTLEILKWGIDPKFLQADKVKLSDFGEMVSLMINSLTDTVYFDKLEEFTDQSSII